MPGVPLVEPIDHYPAPPRCEGLSKVIGADVLSADVYEWPVLGPVALDRRADDVLDRYGNGDWHGTGAAGLAVYGLDLGKALVGREPWQHTHHLESVKVIPSSGANDPDLYGEVTKEAVARAEVAQPRRGRTIVTTVTAKESPRGEATSWSAAIDQLCSGYDDDERRRRLIILAAGNVLPNSTYSHPDTNHLATVEDPAQAWNAITVGAYTERAAITEAEYAHWSCVAEAGDLSPTSRTTIAWEGRSGGAPAPFKPDFVCEGGNWASEGSGKPPSEIDSLSLLTTKRRDGLAARLLGRFGGTSAAASIAARMGALVQSAYPELWPETIRALLVHSCRYTDTMTRSFEGCSPRERAEKRVRCFGDGSPDLDRAMYSARK